MAGSSEQIIIHPGVVDHLEQDKVFVKILAQSACASCHARGACGMADVAEKIIEVQPQDKKNYKPGQRVTVKMKLSHGRKAVMLGYIVPLLILVSAIVTFVLILNNEGLAALLSILLLIPYYLVLYLLRDRLKQQFNFSIFPGE